MEQKCRDYGVAKPEIFVPEIKLSVDEVKPGTNPYLEVKDEPLYTGYYSHVFDSYLTEMKAEEVAVSDARLDIQEQQLHLQYNNLANKHVDDGLGYNKTSHVVSTFDYYNLDRSELKLKQNFNNEPRCSEYLDKCVGTSQLLKKRHFKHSPYKNKNNEKMRMKRLNETDDERAMRLAEQRERNRLRRLQENEEERERRLAYSRERIRSKRLHESEEERLRRLEYSREHLRVRRLQESDEERSKRLTYTRERARMKRLRESHCEREGRLSKMRDRVRSRIMFETDIDRQQRLCKLKDRARVRRMDESHDERTQRLMLQSEATRLRRLHETEEVRNVRLMMSRTPCSSEEEKMLRLMKMRETMYDRHMLDGEQDKMKLSERSKCRPDDDNDEDRGRRLTQLQDVFKPRRLVDIEDEKNNRHFVDVRMKDDNFAKKISINVV